MSWFQLDPESVAERARAGGRAAEVPSLGTSLLRGILGFTVVSVAGFAPWAFAGVWFYVRIGEAGLYGVCALAFIGTSGLFMHRLIIGPGSLPRFYKLFATSFTAYAVAWITGWMLLKGHPGSVVGLLAGTTLMGWMLARAFDAQKATLKVIAALFVLNALGYFVGGVLEHELARIDGMGISKKTQTIIAQLSWGVSYGIGFGAGLGLAFHMCQEKTRALLKTS
jgi:hypothetical protein